MTCAISPTPASRQQFVNALKVLQPFIGESQLAVVRGAARGEERQFFYDKIVELAGIVSAMPKTYEQDGKGDQAVAYLHYFTGGCDWHITERDVETPEQPGQHQAYGQANLGHGSAERGYISIVELLANGAELDFYFKPCALAVVNERNP